MDRPRKNRENLTPERIAHLSGLGRKIDREEADTIKAKGREVFARHESAVQKTPEPVVAFERGVRGRFPSATVTVDVPEHPNGIWYVDVHLGRRWIVIQWDGKGFGVSTDRSACGPGSDAYDSYAEESDAFTRVVALLMGWPDTAEIATDPEGRRPLVYHVCIPPSGMPKELIETASRLGVSMVREGGGCPCRACQDRAAEFDTTVARYERRRDETVR